MRMIERSVRSFFPTDLAADADLLADHLAKATAQSKLNLYTTSKYLSRVKRIMRYAVGRGWLPRDPTTAVASLPYEPMTDPDILTKDEFYTLAKAVRELPISGQRTPKTLEECALALTLLYLTGMRISEALRLEWKHITTERILIHGKGQRLREFPLSPFPLVVDCFIAISALNGGQRKGRVFSWTSYVHLGDVMREASAVVFKDDTRRAHAISGRLHVLRASAEWHWENDLNIDFVTICDLAGHSLAVRERHYRKRHKPAHFLAGRIEGSSPKSPTEGSSPKVTTEGAETDRFLP
ncbi:MAG: tyrosine-type recombinase/integrase [Ignavibacteria bacterium]|nr:tyrosine-type recombinase/integrase [Ignavibacteria bacterium]